ncbi:hypothetical protein [Leptospira santarosai]|uniref:hypothetical protein n=1 Tax=Leptospira santarosai TaxID=28183 RepID=UPI0005183882|nr:hypothetical protein [Leptospira santarosai]
MMFFGKPVFRNICIQSILIIVTAVVFPLQSNSRAPKAVSAAPGSVLFSDSKNVRLVEETLRIFCEDRCSILANYKIESIQKGRFLFTFVLPASAALKVFQGQKVISVASKPDLSIQRLAASMKVQKQYSGFKNYDFPHVGEFQLDLEKGIQEIEIRYSMRPGQDETGFGYFSFGDSDFWGVVEYDLWPAKEWISENFRLTFEMSVPENPSFFLGGKREVTCFDLGKNDSTAKRLEPRESFYHSDKRILRYEFDSKFPDIFRCRYDLKEALYR